MAVRPPVQPITEDLYAGLGPWARRDTDDARYQLLEMCEALGLLQQPVEDLVRDTDEGIGWSAIVDLNRAPSRWLGYLAQFVGARLRDGLDDAAQRARILNTDGFQRGSASALRGAARQYLVGPDGTGATAYVIINERIGANAYRLGVITLTSQTPDPDAVLVALMEQKPAGIILEYETVAGTTYGVVRIAYDTYAELRDAYVDYAHLRLDLPVGS